MGPYLAVKKNGIMTFQVNGWKCPCDPEVTQIQKGNRCMFSVVFGSFFQTFRCEDTKWSNPRKIQSVWEVRVGGDEDSRTQVPLTGKHQEIRR